MATASTPLAPKAVTNYGTEQNEATRAPGRSITNRKASLDHHGEEIVTPGRFTGFVSKRPCVCCWGTFTIILLIAFASVQVVTMAAPDATAGMDTASIPTQADFYTWSRGVSKDVDIYTPGENPNTTPEQRPPSPPASFTTMFLYEGLESANALTASGVAAMATMERAMLETTIYAENCAKATSTFNSSLAARCASPQTLLNYLYVNDAAHRAQCLAGFCQAPVPQVALEAFCTSSGNSFGTFPCVSTVYDWRDGTLATDMAAAVNTRLCATSMAETLMPVMLSNDATCTSSELTAPWARAHYTMHGNSFNETTHSFNTRLNDQVQAASKVIDETQTSVSATAAVGAWSTATAPADGKVINVFTSMFPDWRDPDQLRTTAALMNDMGLAFMSLVLVFVCLLVNTGSLLLTYAGLFEIVMSFPMAMALWAVCGQSQYGIMEMLGFILILCIGADDVFVFCDTWKESQYLPPSISGSLESRFVWTYNRAANAMLTTTLTTTLTLLLNVISPLTMLRSFGLFNAFVVMADYVMVITWFASSVLALERFTSSLCPPGRNFEFSCCCPGKLGQEAPKERAITAWMRDSLGPFLLKARWVFLALTFGIAAGGVAVSAALFKEGELQPYVASSAQPMAKMIQLSQLFGSTHDTKRTVVTMYGLDDPALTYPNFHDFYANQDEDVYNAAFDVHYSSSFEFTPAVQTKMTQDCVALADNPTITAKGERYCILNDLAAYDPASFPYADEAALRTALVAFYASDAYGTLQYNYTGYSYLTGFTFEEPPATGIKAIWQAYNTTMPTSLIPGLVSRPVVAPYYDDWKAAVDTTCDASAPCVFTDTESLFMQAGNQLALRNEAMMNLGLALLIAYLVLVMNTMNLIVPILVIVSIIATLACTLASVFLCGVTFQTYTSIFIVLTVGLAVDYPVHLAHYYNHADSSSSFAKAKEALHGIGLSIINGAVTTGGAGLPLIFVPNFEAFRMFGLFIAFVAFYSVFFTFFLLTPLLMVAGPTDDTGDLKAIWKALMALVKKEDKHPKFKEAEVPH